MRAALILYGVIAAGAAVPVFGSDICTQYDMGLTAVLTAPLLVLFGLFVVFALAFGLASTGAFEGFLALGLLALGGGATVLLIVAVIYSERRWLWGGVFLVGQFLTSVLATFAFCASLSV